MIGVAGINLDIVANVTNFLRGTRNVSDALSDVSDSVDDLGRDSQDAGRDIGRSFEKAGDKIGDSFKDGAKDASTAVDRLERDIKSSMDAAEKATKGAGNAFDSLAKDARKVGDSGKKEFHRASEGAREFKDEARQNFGEVASSFQGDMTSIQDLAQGTFGGLAGSLTGPLGLAFGALSVGVGLFISQAQKAKEQADAMFDSLVDGAGRVQAAGVDDKIRDMIKDGTAADLKRKADALGISFRDLARGLAGDPDALDRSRRALAGLGDQYSQTTTQVAGYQQYQSDAQVAYQDLNVAIKEQSDLLGAASGDYQLYKDAASAAATSTDTLTEAQQGAAAALEETKQVSEEFGTAADAFTAALDANAKAAGKNADDVTASIAQVNDELQKQVDAYNNWQSNLVTLAKRGVDEGVIKELEKLGPAGAQQTALLVSSTDAELQRYVSLTKQRAQQGTQGFQQSLLDSIPGLRGASAAIRQAVIDEIGGDIPVNVKVTSTGVVEAYRTLDDLKRAASTGINVQMKYAAIDRAVP